MADEMEGGGVVASQAQVVIGADWTGVEQAFTAVNRLENKLKTFNGTAEVRLKMPDTKSLTAKINAELTAGLSKPFVVNVAAKLQADSIASIQSQLSSQVFTIRVRPEVVGGSGIGGAPLAGNAATSYNSPPPRFGSTGYRPPSYGSWSQDQQQQEMFSGAYSQQMMQQQQSGGFRPTPIPPFGGSPIPPLAEQEALRREAQLASLNHAAYRSRLGALAVADRGFNPANIGATLASRFSITEQQQMKLQQDARRSYFAGQTLTRTVTLPAAIIGGAMVYQGAKFDSQFGKIGALTDTPRDLIPGLKQQSIDISMGRGERYPVTAKASQVADAYYQVASAGYTGAAGRRIAKVSAEGSTIGLGDSNTIADVVTSTLSAYQLPPSEAKEIVNKLLKGAIFGKGEASEYAPALPKVLSTAAIAGVDFSQVMGSLATMSRIGIKPEAGATALNQLLMHVVAPTPQGDEALNKMGWNRRSIKRDIQTQGLDQVARQIIERSDKVSGGDGTALQEQLLGNVRGWKALMATAGTQPESYKQAMKKINDANDQTAESMKRIADTAEVQWKRIGNIISGTSLQISQRWMPGITKTLESTANNLPNTIGRAGDVLDMAGTPGKTALGLGLGALALSGPAFHMMAVAKDMRSFRPGIGLGRFGMGAAGIYGLGVGANYLNDRYGANTVNDNEVLMAQLGLAGATAYPMLSRAGVGVEAGVGRFSGNVSNLLSRGRDTYAAYSAVRAAEGLPGGLRNAASFIPWMASGGNIAGPSLAGPPLGQAGMLAALGGRPTMTGLAGAGTVVGLGVAAIGGYDFYRQTQRELREREDSRKALYTGATLISKEFEKGDRFASSSSEASNRLGDIATKFSGASQDAAQLRDRIKELNQLKIDINAGTLKMSPLAAQELKISADKIIKQVQDQIKAVEVQVKIKGSWEGFKDDVGQFVGGQQPWQRNNAAAITSFGSGLLDPLGVNRYIGGKLVSGAGAVSGFARGLLDPLGVGSRVAPYLGAEDGAALPVTGGPRGLRPSVNSKGQFVTPAGPSALSESQIEKTVQGILGINLRNGTDMAGFIGGASKAQIDKLQAALTGKDKDRLRSALGGDFISRIVARQTALQNSPTGNNAGGGSDPVAPSQSQVDALEKQRRALESDAEAMNKRASAYGAFGSTLDSIIGKARSFSDETDKMRLNNELHKRSLDAVDESYKKQALTVAGLIDRMKELNGTKNTLRGFNEGLESAVSGVGGNLGGLRSTFGQESALLGYSGRMGLLSNAAISRGIGLGNIANTRSLDYAQQAKDLTAQAGAVGSDATGAFNAMGKGQPFIGGDPGGGTYGGVKSWVAASGHRIASRFHPLGVGGVGSRGNASDHPNGLALDFMAAKGGTRATGAALEKGNEMAAYAQANAGQEDVKYIIWNDKIWSPGRASEGWRPYVNPQLKKKGVDISSDRYNTLQHRDHVHVSYNSRPGVVNRSSRAVASITPASDAHESHGHSSQSAIYRNAKGKPFVARTAVGFDRQQDEAMPDPQRFDGVDDSIFGRTLDLQWALGGRIRPNQYNQNQFALQQFFEQKGVQVSLGNLARQYQYDAKGKKQLSDKEVADLAAMDSMSDAQRAKLMQSRPAILGKLGALMKKGAVFTDREVKSFTGSQTFVADQKQRALGMFAARNPGDAIGLKELQLSQDLSLSPLQRKQMLAGFTDIEKAAGWEESRQESRSVNDASAGYKEGRNYVSGNANWNEAELSIAQQLGTYQSQREYALEKRYGGKGLANYRKNRLQADMRLMRTRLRSQRNYDQFLGQSSDSRNAWASSDDSAALGAQIGLGRDSELAGLEIQRDRFAKNYVQSGRGSLAQGQALGRLNYNTQIQGIENSNLSRYIQDIKAIDKVMASLGDTTGNVARAFDLWDEKLGMGLSTGQKFNLLTKNLEQQQAQRDFQIGQESAPLFYGPSGARNQSEVLQAQLDNLRSTRDSRLAAAMKANPNLPASAITQQFDAQEKDKQDQIDAANRNDPRSMRNQTINSFDATKNRHAEEMAALRALTDADKERLYVLREQNRYAEAGLKFDEEAKTLAEQQAKETTAMNKELQQASKVRGMMNGFTDISGRAFENLLSNNGADRYSKRRQAMGLEMEWANLSMDMLDRGIDPSSSDYKNAQKRYKQLGRESRGKGRISEFLSDTFGGFADETRRVSAGAVNDAAWNKLSPILGGFLLPSSAKGGAAGNIASQETDRLGITGFAGKVAGALFGGKGTETGDVTLSAQNVYLNGQPLGAGNLQLGGTNSIGQAANALGAILQKRGK